LFRESDYHQRVKGFFTVELCARLAIEAVAVVIESEGHVMFQVKLFKANLRATLLIGAGTAALIAGSPTASAQEVSSNQPVETVVVTGTLIHRSDYDTPSPIQVIDASQIKALGYTSTADLLQSIPDNNSGAVATAFTGALAFGGSGVSLRGLLEDSTLILIDGHRTSQYPLTSDGERSFTDLNTIPLDAVAQVQVLQDGASSIYGADAIGGVVNIILKHDFQGVEASAEGGTSQQGGGSMTHDTVTLGYGDLASDHFNFYINGEYEYDGAIKAGQRGFPFNTNDLSSIGGLNNIGGQPQQDSGSIYGSVTPATEGTAGNILTGVPNPGALSQVLAPGGCGSLGKFTTTPGVGSYCTQNMELYQDDQPQTARDGIYARATVEPNAHTDVYLDLSYFHYEDDFTGIPVPPGPAQIQATSQTNTDTIVLPARLTGANGPGTGSLNPNDPFPNSPNCVEGLPFGKPNACTDALINYAFGDLPPSTGVSNNNIRATLEAQGEYWGWSYDGALTVAHSWVLLNIQGALNFPQLETDINDGAYNFLYPSKNSPSLLHTLSPVMSSDSTSDENSLDFSATRGIFDLPGGTTQLGLGAEYRTEDLNSPSFNSNLQGQDYQSSFASGNRRVASVFGELDMPILPTLEADLSGRFDHYSDFGNTANPKLGLKWTPIPIITFRGTASTGFKAPGFAENGNSQSAGYVTTTGASYSPAWAATHGNDGYAENTYSLEQISTSFHGIKPETSRNFTGGTVVKPFDNVTASLDYYYIQKWDAIQFPNSGNAIIPYLEGLPLPPGYSIIPDAPDPLFPHAIPRPAVVSAPYVNSGTIITDGLDMSITATFPLTSTLNYTTQFNGTHIFEYFSKVPGLPTLQWAGTESPCEYTSCEGTPRDRFTWSHTLDFGPYSVTGTLLYISGEKNIESDLVPPDGTIYPFRGGSGFWDFNLHAAYDITDQMQVFGNILNVANSPPPIQPAQYGGINYNPVAYQAGIVGRFFQLGISYKTN
jgi:iron complex outermembrane receptor protein